MAGEVEHGHVEPGGPASDGPADAAVADDAERGPVHVLAQTVEQPETRPTAGA